MEFYVNFGVEYFDQVIQLYPDDEKSNFYRGLAHAAQNELSEINS